MTEPLNNDRLAEIRAGLEGLPEGPWTVEDRYESGNRDGQRFDNGLAAVMALSDCDSHPLADCSCNHTCRMGYEQEAIAKHIARLDPQTVSALLARLDKAEARLSLASTFWLNGSIAIERRANDSWAIKDGGNVLCADGEWEYEPFPSSRTDEFIARTRFTLDDAFHRAKAALPPPPSSES